jgi:DNA-binding transcriptional ArsR family regulator
MRSYRSVGAETYIDDDGVMTYRDPLGSGEAMANLARLLADETRATFCLALLDRRAWTVTELARHADVAMSTASEHTSRLIDGGLLAEERRGRNRYVRIASPDVAHLIETITSAAGRQRAPVASLSGANRQQALSRARTCYDHLAGRLGVAIADAMTERGFVSWEHGLAVTSDGETWLATLGVDVRAKVGERANTRRPMLRSCLDWTERRPHLGGSVAAAVCRHAFDASWLGHIGETRAVIITDVGRDALAHHFGLTDDVLGRDPVAAHRA